MPWKLSWPSLQACISHLGNVDTWEHVLEHGCHQLHVQTLTTETVQHYKWCILVQLLKHKLLLHCTDNISCQGVVVYPERECGALW